jgi:hypothetical protein
MVHTRHEVSLTRPATKNKLRFDSLLADSPRCVLDEWVIVPLFPRSRRVLNNQFDVTTRGL